MNCKNCNDQLDSKFSFCPSCGARVVLGRITLLGLLKEVQEKLFNIDNKLFKTFIGLFKNPKDVVIGYLEGTRKKYVDPISYFTIALAANGAYFFIQNKFYPNMIDQMLMASDQSEEFQNVFTAMMENMFEYFSFWTFLMIPVFALISKLVFLNYKKYNFGEHLILNTYCYSQVSIVVAALYILTIFHQPTYRIMLLFAMPIQIAYYIYALAKIFKLSFKKIILKTLLFFVVMLILYIILSIITMIFLFFFSDGFKEIIENAKAKKAVAYIASYTSVIRL